MSGPVTYEGDLYSEEGILHPYGHYRAIRDLGPAVWLSAQRVYAVGRYDDARAVLADHDTFRSGEGVGLNEDANRVARGLVLTSDPPQHDHLRQIVAHRLTPRALRTERAAIEAKADEVVSRVLGAGVIDAVTDIAQAMPMAVVPEFIGFPEDCHPHLLPWAKAALETAGPVSDRTPAALEVVGGLIQYAGALVQDRRVLAGSLGEDLLAAADRGEISHQQCPSLILDYFGPSMETTVSALGSALALFAQNPDQWHLLRDDPSLVGNAFNEIIRLESPLRGFSRLADRDTEIGGAPLPAGARVLVLFASANRDERKWDRPDEFDITRDNADHLALGYGLHGCAGQGLARIEVTSVLTRLAESVTRLEAVGEPVPLVNSTIRAYESFPLRLHTA